MCAPVMVELEGETDPLQIAVKELKYVLLIVTHLLLQYNSDNLNMLRLGIVRFNAFFRLSYKGSVIGPQGLGFMRLMLTVASKQRHTAGLNLKIIYYVSAFKTFLLLYGLGLCAYQPGRRLLFFIKHFKFIF